MKHALLIFNGIKYTYALADKAIEWAKKNSLPLHAIFLSGPEHEEQYPFPSDLDAAQNDTDKNDAERGDFRVVESRIKLLQDTATGEGVDCTSEILVEPSLDEVLAKAANAEVIFINADEVNDVPMTVRGFAIKDLVAGLPEGKLAR